MEKHSHVEESGNAALRGDSDQLLQVLTSTVGLCFIYDLRSFFQQGHFIPLEQLQGLDESYSLLAWRRAAEYLIGKPHYWQSAREVTRHLSGVSEMREITK